MKNSKIKIQNNFLFRKTAALTVFLITACAVSYAAEQASIDRLVQRVVPSLAIVEEEAVKKDHQRGQASRDMGLLPS